MKAMRLFVAVELPEDVRAALASLGGGVPGARWVPEENMHLTLRFLGEVDGGTGDDIAESLSEVRGEPFELCCEGIGHFETARQPRTIWAGVSASPELRELQARVEKAVQRAGLPPETRKFMPHVTLARLKAAPADRVHSFIAHHNLFRSRPFEVNGFTLFSSFLSKSNPIYRAEAEFDIRGNDEETSDEEFELYDPWSSSQSDADERS